MADTQGKTDKPDVSLNDLEKDLAKGNERVKDFLNDHAIVAGEYIKGRKDSEQNNPKNPDIDDSSYRLTALEVAEGAVKKDKKSEDKKT